MKVMNTFTKGLRAFVCGIGVFVAPMTLPATAFAQEQQPAAANAAQTRLPANLPANYIDCSRYEEVGYNDRDGNRGRDGVSDAALSRTPEENNARLCSGLPVYTGDTRMIVTTTWDRGASLLFKVFGDRPIGHQENGTTRLGWVTYPGSPTPISQTPIFAELATTTNGNATLGRAAASILPSATNGVGAAVVNNLLSPCRGGGCNSGPSVINNNLVDGAEALAVNSATAASGSSLDAVFGSCGTGTCGSPASSTTSTQPAAMVNPAQQPVE